MDKIFPDDAGEYRCVLRQSVAAQPTQNPGVAVRGQSLIIAAFRMRLHFLDRFSAVSQCGKKHFVNDGSMLGENTIRMAEAI
jgi:hypothetical protein